MEQSRTQAQEATQQGSGRVETIDSLSAVEAGYIVPEPVPKPVKCKYCGRELKYYGLVAPMMQKRVLVWRSAPERCTCEKAKAFWERYDEKEVARKEQEARDAAAAEEMARFEKLMERSGMKGRFQNRRFENFVQNTDDRRRAYDQAKRYADNFERMLPHRNERGKVTAPEIQRNGLMIAGTYGTGKTHLAAAIANELISRNTPVICMTMIDLLDRIRETYDSTDDMNEAAILKKYQDVPLLIIDDIGSEQPTEWGVAKIFAIINSRYEAYMPTIVTTNYSGSELEQRMTPDAGDDRNAKKTIDRLKETCVGIEMSWTSWRVK